jgi:anti-sigma regulatory factor (Ser/Thr protein kinase)
VIVILAERQLELALAEQARCTTRFHRSIGSVGELSAYASLRAASRNVTERDRAVREAQRGPAHFAFTLLADETAPSQARSEVTDRLRDRIDHSVVKTVALLLSETVTNAVTHGLRSDRETVDLDGQLLADRVRLEVANAGPAFDHVAHLPSPSDRGGRGLMLVDALSCAWGHEHADGVTGVWFEVAA